MKVQGRRKRGRPKRRWLDRVRDDVKENGLLTEEVYDRAYMEAYVIEHRPQHKSRNKMKMKMKKKKIFFLNPFYSALFSETLLVKLTPL